ncbi:MAG: hypothetical protein QXG12_07335 [Thermoproteota archaeon]
MKPRRMRQQTAERKRFGSSIQKALQLELEKLKRKTGMGQGLKVEWLPNRDLSLSGEVKHKTIYVYEENEVKAIETLRHEFIDYLLSQAIEPHRSIANKLIQLLNEIAYRKKEEIVKAILKLL